jgi:hypothetical protein
LQSFPLRDLLVIHEFQLDVAGEREGAKTEREVSRRIE